LSEEKTVVTHACDGLDFLGFHIQHYPAHDGRRAITLVRPSDKSMDRLKDKIRDMTDRARFVDNPKDKVVALNAVLRGWINYYRHCNAKQVASDLDHWVHLRVARWLVHRHKSNYRDVLQQYLKQEGNRKNFAVQQTDGSDLFLVLMRDLPLTPYRRRACPNPYLRKTFNPPFWALYNQGAAHAAHIRRESRSGGIFARSGWARDAQKPWAFQSCARTAKRISLKVADGLRYQAAC